jgi:hypothetical protein
LSRLGLGDVYALTGRFQPLADAFVFLGLGRKDETFSWLDRAYEERDARRLAFLNIDPMFDPLRPGPRFPDLLRRMNFPQ